MSEAAARLSLRPVRRCYAWLVECNTQTHPRLAFWAESAAIFDLDAPWSERLDSLCALVRRYDGGMALVEAGAFPGSLSPNAVAPELPLEVSGYRAFLKHWGPGDETGIHGHPNTMFVYVISATLESIGFRLDGDTLVTGQTLASGPGETFNGEAANTGFDNFIHQLRCIRPGWSLHVYSDAPERGAQF